MKIENMQVICTECKSLVRRGFTITVNNAYVRKKCGEVPMKG